MSFKIRQKVVKNKGLVIGNITINNSNLSLIDTLNIIANNSIKIDYEANKDIVLSVFDFFKKSIRKNKFNEDIIEIGYQLTDIFERNECFDNSIYIANEIINIYKNTSKKATIEYKRKYLHKMIGCAYSLAIAKKRGKEKEYLLNRAEELFDKIKSECDEFINNPDSGYQNIQFISGLYYSDYGAFLLNKGDFYKYTEIDEDYLHYYEDAKDYHNKSLLNRQELFNSIAISDKTAKQEALLRVARSKRNIGSTLFRLEDYKSAVALQKDAIKDFETTGNKEEKYTAIDYLTGGYIAMWESNINDFFIDEFTDCCRKLSLLREYYSEGNSRYETAIKRIGVLKQIIEKLAPDNQSSAQNIFTIILGE